jgi:hypothetical protein
MDMAQAVPFDCPDNCIFFEPRAISGVGWSTTDGEAEPESNDKT